MYPTISVGIDPAGLATACSIPYLAYSRCLVGTFEMLVSRYSNEFERLHCARCCANNRMRLCCEIHTHLNATRPRKSKVARAAPQPLFIGRECCCKDVETVKESLSSRLDVQSTL